MFEWWCIGPQSQWVSLFWLENEWADGHVTNWARPMLLHTNYSLENVVTKSELEAHLKQKNVWANHLLYLILCTWICLRWFFDFPAKKDGRILGWCFSYCFRPKSKSKKMLILISPDLSTDKKSPRPSTTWQNVAEKVLRQKGMAHSRWMDQQQKNGGWHHLVINTLTWIPGEWPIFRRYSIFFYIKGCNFDIFSAIFILVACSASHCWRHLRSGCWQPLRTWFFFLKPTGYMRHLIIHPLHSTHQVQHIIVPKWCCTHVIILQISWSHTQKSRKKNKKTSPRGIKLHLSKTPAASLQEDALQHHGRNLPLVLWAGLRVRAARAVKTRQRKWQLFQPKHQD